MTAKVIKTISALGLAATLPACGGSGSTGGVPQAPQSFEQLEAQSSALLNKYGIDSINDPSTLRVTGSSDYAGVMTLHGEDARQFRVSGQMNLNVNFATNDVAGTVSNFVDLQETRYTGTLAIGRGSIDRASNPDDAEPTFSAALNGALTSGTTSLDIDGLMSGYFQGEDAAAVQGFLSGDLSVGSTTAPLFGGFIGER